MFNEVALVDVDGLRQTQAVPAGAGDLRQGVQPRRGVCTSEDSSGKLSYIVNVEMLVLHVVLCSSCFSIICKHYFHL